MTTSARTQKEKSLWTMSTRLNAGYFDMQCADPIYCRQSREVAIDRRYTAVFSVHHTPSMTLLSCCAGEGSRQAGTHSWPSFVLAASSPL
jgi:hypothetical protein